DCRAVSSGGNFVLEARSPHNRTINHREGRPVADEEFAYKYGSFQREFRYRLLAGPGDPLAAAGNRSGRVLWERWQGDREDSPRELIVGDDGWSAIRTHGFRPEVILVSPAGGDTVRVRVVDRHAREETADGGDAEPLHGKAS